MAKALFKTTTTTVTESMEIFPAEPGAEQTTRFMTVGGYGSYRRNGRDVLKPKINLNAKWLYDAGFDVGDKIEIDVAENQLVIRKLAME